MYAADSERRIKPFDVLVRIFFNIQNINDCSKETQLEVLLIDERNHGRNMGNSAMPSSPLTMDAIEINEEDDEVTPRPCFVKHADVDLGQETEIEDSDEAFKTLLLSLAKRKKYLTTKIFQNTEDLSEEEHSDNDAEDLKMHKKVHCLTVLCNQIVIINCQQLNKHKTINRDRRATSATMYVVISCLKSQLYLSTFYSGSEDLNRSCFSLEPMSVTCICF